MPDVIAAGVLANKPCTYHADNALIEQSRLLCTCVRAWLLQCELLGACWRSWSAPCRCQVGDQAAKPVGAARFSADRLRRLLLSVACRCTQAINTYRCASRIARSCPHNGVAADTPAPAES